MRRWRHNLISRLHIVVLQASLVAPAHLVHRILPTFLIPTQQGEEKPVKWRKMRTRVIFSIAVRTVRNTSHISCISFLHLYSLNENISPQWWEQNTSLINDCCHPRTYVNGKKLIYKNTNSANILCRCKWSYQYFVGVSSFKPAFLSCDVVWHCSKMVYPSLSESRLKSFHFKDHSHLA